VFFQPVCTSAGACRRAGRRLCSAAPFCPDAPGGLGSARLRRIKEFVDAKIEDELTLCEMAQEVELSPAYFSRMFRKSTGETPHQFLLRQRGRGAPKGYCAPPMVE